MSSVDQTVPAAAAVVGRPVRDSQAIYTELTLPNDANALGTLFGGKLMQFVDLCAAISATLRPPGVC